MFKVGDKVVPSIYLDGQTHWLTHDSDRVTESVEFHKNDIHVVAEAIFLTKAHQGIRIHGFTQVWHHRYWELYKTARFSLDEIE